MSKPKRHERKAKVPEISANIDRFKYSLSEAFGSTKVEDRGEYVVMHERIPLENRHFVDVIVYTTDRMYLSASPFVPVEMFNRVATEVIRLAQQSTTRLAKVRPLTLQRARNILDFASRLDPTNDFERMVIVILADTSNEISLTEQMKAAEIGGAALDYGIPAKIKCLKDKGEVVFKADEMKNVRELRNGIVHQGNIPDKTQAIEALKIAHSVLDWMYEE